MKNPIDLEEFRKVLRNLVDDPSDENFKRVNQIRMWFVHSTKMTEGISRQVQGLTRKLLTPTEEDMKIIHQMILSCRFLASSSEHLVKDYEIMCEEGILVSEIEDFKKACLRLKKATYHIESVYLNLSDTFLSDNLLRRN
jgi:hypothetical protein